MRTYTNASELRNPQADVEEYLISFERLEINVGYKTNLQSCTPTKLRSEIYPKSYAAVPPSRFMNF